MKAPIGATVGIYYDGQQLNRGDFLRTPSGRIYRAISVRVQQRGRHRGRQHLRCLVVDEAASLLGQRAGAREFPLVWYPRGRAASQRRALG